MPIYTQNANPAQNQTSPALPIWLHRFLVDFRVVISSVLFSTLIAAQMLVGLRPHGWRAGDDMQGLAGVLLVLLGLFIRSWAAGVLMKGKALAVNGPYSLCRHPLYLGSFCMMVGFCLLVGNPLHLAIVLGPIAGIYWVTMLNEERRMTNKYGQAWTEYAAAVPRFVPWRLFGYKHAPFSLSRWSANHEYRALFTAVAGLTALEIWRMY